MIQRPDFWDTVAKNVHVHRNDIERLDDHTIVLKDGPSLPMDVIVCATGFVNEYPFFTTEQRVTLGLSHPRSENITEDEWSVLEAGADKEVLAKHQIVSITALRLLTTTQSLSSATSTHPTVSAQQKSKPYGQQLSSTAHYNYHLKRLCAMT
jgi:hypothetical protein